MKYFPQQNFSNLKNHIVIVDIDGTLTDSDKSDMSQATIKKITALKKHNEIYICSNSPDQKRNKLVAKLVKAHFLQSPYKKPNPKIIDFIENTKQKPIIVIGDQYWTDGRFAKYIDAKFIKVKRIKSPGNRPYVKLIHKFDDLMAKIFEK